MVAEHVFESKNTRQIVDVNANGPMQPAPNLGSDVQ
jgi:hypothetical protein